MHTFSRALRVSFAAASLILPASAVWAQDNGNAFTFSYFTVTGATTLSVESINNSGLVSGYYSDASSNTISFLRTSSGAVRSYSEPLDTTSPTYTQGGQINKFGWVAGEFFDTSLGTYIGYVYKAASQSFVTYQVPGEPQFTTVGLIGINDNAAICGFTFPPPYTIETAFVESGGVVTQFTVNSSVTNACSAINNSGTSVGFYTDSSGTFHGWKRTVDGTITTFDAPGAAITPGTAPCISSPVAGTVPLGINNNGFVSGHYWDTSYNEHGFLMTPGGVFYPIDAPGAFQTSGGGLNDKIQIVGHYVDSTCNYTGYVAAP